MAGSSFPLFIADMGGILTPRESQILALLGEGRTSKEIAVTLKVSVGTIASHRRSLCRKLDLHSTAELVHYGAQVTRAT